MYNPIHWVESSKSVKPADPIDRGSAYSMDKATFQDDTGDVACDVSGVCVNYELFRCHFPLPLGFEFWFERNAFIVSAVGAAEIDGFCNGG